MSSSMSPTTKPSPPKPSRLAVLLLLSCAGLTACRTPPPPPRPLTYESIQEAKRVVVERQQQVRAVQAECEIRIYPADEPQKSHGFDGAVVYQSPDQFRLRTWKLTQTLFDLTVTPEGTWVMVSDQLTDRLPKAESDLAQLADHLPLLLRGPDFSDAEFSGRTAGPLHARWDRGSAELDPMTLTPTSYYFDPGDGEPPISVNTTYGSYDGQLWYHRVIIAGEFGSADLTFRDVKVNQPLNPRAFRPPRRAVAQ